MRRGGTSQMGFGCWWQRPSLILPQALRWRRTSACRLKTGRAGEAGGGVRPTGLGVFVTPTIVHFGGVLALAAYLSMPHQGVWSLSAGFGAIGLAGLVY